VQTYVKFHEIAPNAPNSYPRRHIVVSKPTQEIADYIRDILPPTTVIEFNNRSVCQGLELDILVPDAKFAVEYHGLFHHVHRPDASTFSQRKDKTYHLTKLLECEKVGIHLMQIFSDEWRDKKSIVKSVIAAKLHRPIVRLFARNCQTVRQLDTHTKNEFLNTNHLQGEDKSSVKLGLFDQTDALVAVMTFGRPRFSRSADWELMRYATLINHAVVGGAGKLLAHAYTHKLIDGSVVSYSDRRYSTGQMYDRLGFVKHHVNPPSYYYVNTAKDIRIHRMHLQKRNFPQYTDKTEAEIADVEGYKRVYDCGTVAWIYTPILP
jgi:hypothetical protein